MIPPRSPSRVACGIWIGAAIVLTGVLLAQAETKALRSFGNDFTAYLDAARALAGGGNPYLASERFPYSYPLTLAWMLTPLLAVPIWLAAAVWFGVTVFAYWRLVNYSAAAGDRRLTRCEAVALAVIVAVALLQIVQNELLNGQINSVVTATAVGAVALSAQRHPMPAATLWGLGIALKLFPLILAPWFLFRRRWTEFFGGLLVAVVLGLVPVLWVGSDAIAWTREYFERVSAGRLGAAGVADFIHLNAAWAVGRIAGFGTPPAWLRIVVTLAFVGAAVAVDLRRRAGDGMRSAVLFLSLVVLLSPKSETHHMMFTIPAVVMLAVRADTALRLIGIALIVLTFNIGFVTPPVRDALLLGFALATTVWCAHDVLRG